MERTMILSAVLLCIAAASDNLTAEQAGSPILMEEDLFYAYKGPLILLVCASLVHMVQTCWKATYENGGIPQTHAFEGHVDSFTNPHLMNKLAKERMEQQSLNDFRYFPMLMNRPWMKEKTRHGDSDYQWGGDTNNLPPNIDWMGNEPFPKGETRTDSCEAMTVAFWKFMFTWKRAGGRWCVFVMVLRGLVIPMGAQVTAWALDEIDRAKQGRADVGLLKGVPGSPKQILMCYAVILMALYGFDSMLQWSYELEIPEGGPRRELKLRLQRKFMSMNVETRKSWPPSRCTAVIEQDVKTVIRIWTDLMYASKSVASLVATVLIALLNNHDLQSAASYAPVFLIVVTFAVIDYRQRAALLQDMSRRSRAWIAAESTVSTHALRLSREDEHADAAELDSNFFEVSFVVWYRTTHSWFYQVSTDRASNLTTHLALAIVVFTCGERVLDGHMTMGECTAVVLLLGIFCNVITTIVSIGSRLALHYPSLVIVSEVFNVDEVFGDECDSDVSGCSEDSSLGAKP